MRPTSKVRVDEVGAFLVTTNKWKCTYFNTPVDVEMDFDPPSGESFSFTMEAPETGRDGPEPTGFGQGARPGDSLKASLTDPRGDPMNRRCPSAHGRAGIPVSLSIGVQQTRGVPTNSLVRSAHPRLTPPRPTPHLNPPS
jgi:hypothetical protein